LTRTYRELGRESATQIMDREGDTETAEGGR
jgi:hypothetical protein